MQTVSGLFDSYADASAALRDLHAAGIPNADLAVISGDERAAEPAKPPSLASDGSDGGAEAGVVLGGAGGLLAGGGLVTIPGIGPVLAGGWLAEAAGNTEQGIIGAMIAGGVPEADAHVYAEGVRRGGTLVSARNEAAQAVIAIFVASHAVDIAARRADFERDGWTAFDETGAPLTTVRWAATQVAGT
jgi:hypothetical protein